MTKSTKAEQHTEGDGSLGSDALGTKGETKFADLCSDAQLQANKVDLDRAGWDYVVHLTLPDDGKATLDLRDNHATAFIQVKALWKSRKPRIRLRLSAIEKLAKQTSPAFLFAFEFDRNDLSKFSIYAIEFVGPHLEWVLKELRKRQASGKRAVNSSYVTLTPKSISLLKKPTGLAIRQLIVDCLPDGPSAYAAKKSAELKSIGFDEFRHKITGTAEIEIENIADVLLGKRPLTVLVSNAFETRFGIPLPIDRTGPATVQIVPDAAACTLHYTSSDGYTRLRFSGECTRAVYPGPMDIIWKARFDFGIFSIEHGSDGSRISLNLDIDDDREFPLKTFVDFYRFLISMHKGNSLQKIRVDGLADPLEWKVPMFDKFDLEQLELRLMIFRALSEVDRDAGTLIASVNSKQVYKKQQDIISAWGFSGKRDRALRISVASQEPGPQASRNILYIGSLDISNCRFAYCSVVDMEYGDIEGEDRWYTTNVSPMGVQAIDSSPASFANFVEEQKEISGLSEILLHEGNNDFYREALGEIGVF